MTVTSRGKPRFGQRLPSILRAMDYGTTSFEDLRVVLADATAYVRAAFARVGDAWVLRTSHAVVGVSRRDGTRTAGSIRILPWLPT